MPSMILCLALHYLQFVAYHIYIHHTNVYVCLLYAAQIYHLSNPEVLEAILQSTSDGFPYVSIFLRKNSPHGWGKAPVTSAADNGDSSSSSFSSSATGTTVTSAASSSSSSGEAAVESEGDSLLYYPEVIKDLDQIYSVGTFAKVYNYRRGAGGSDVSKTTIWYSVQLSYSLFMIL
jgi:hypothetical protein